MLSVLASVLGGIGLFLLGMILMTDGLKAVAGDALRSILSRYTTNRYSAVLAGAGVTALVQSSSATTVATIGFVSAGLLTFQNAISVNIGAALGTTSTGWLVSLLGLKLSIGKVLLPLIGVGALAKLLTRGKVAHAGIAVAGFGVIFVGIDVLQGGMKDLSGLFDPGDFPQATFGGRIVLALIGIAMTVIMQSSSAAVATTLAALSGGTIGFEQAASLVIGQNVGTTITAGIASLGASTPAKRAALAHILYNASTSAVAFLVMPLYAGVVRDHPAMFSDHASAIAAFHSGFNLLGVILFLPLVPLAARMLERLIKLKGPRLTRDLDTSLLNVPPLAVEAVRRALKTGGAELLEFLAAQLRRDKPDAEAEIVQELDVALDDMRRFLAQVPPPDAQGFEFHRQISTVHAIDHLERLIVESRETGKIAAARQDPVLLKTCEDLASLLDLLAKQIREPLIEPDVDRAEAFSKHLADERRNARPAILEATAARRIDPDIALRRLSAQRWLDRVAYHVWRIAHHLREMTRKEAADFAHSAADAGTAAEGDVREL